jgi:hypothetical protein
MERPEQVIAVEEQLAEPAEQPDAVVPSATPIERRAGWADRRQQPEDR